MTDEAVDAEHTGDRRATSWQEPTYKPEIAKTLTKCNWDFANNTGPARSFLSANEYKTMIEKGVTRKLHGLTFQNCDFQGLFDSEGFVIFDNCRFLACDFAFSQWRNVNFRECKFIKTSLSLRSFSSCEFRDCFWEDLGFSGSKTEFYRSFVTNPKALIDAGFSAPNPSLKGNREHEAYQKMRLEGTKAHLARTLLLNYQAVGDDTTFYQCARVHDLQQCLSRIFA